jgi:GntR family galactonate operon transcriptional repressor
MIEPDAAAAAALRSTPEDVTELADALTAIRDAGDDFVAVTAADLWFHRALLRSTHIELLMRMSIVIETGLRARDVLVHSFRRGAICADARELSPRTWCTAWPVVERGVVM